MNIDLLKCSSKLQIKDVLKKMDLNTERTVFCVDENDRFLGVMTEGDVRRLLLNGFGLNEPIEKHINKKNVVAYDYENQNDIVDKLNGTISIIPILNNNNNVVDYISFSKHVCLAQPQLNGNEYKYLMDAFLSSWISSTGKYVTQFENIFSNYCGSQFGVSTANGTVAIHLALSALGIGSGDEVIVPDLTFAATINAVLYTGAKPVIVDIDEESWCISPERIREAITERTRAIIPVHLYGQPCDMNAICKIADEFDLYIIEDCAEAHGAEYNGKKVGTFGDIGCFSFYGNKVVTTGEGGMCITNNSELFERMRVLRDHGMRKDKRYYHDVIGYNYRMTNMQAAIGTAQVERIDSILQWRSELEQSYRNRLCKCSNVTLQRNDMEKRKKIAWLVSILVKDREKIMEMLSNENIDARPFFVPLSQMELYKEYAFKPCIYSKLISKDGINLPTTFFVDNDTIERIARIIESV